MWWFWWVFRFTWDQFIILYSPSIVLRLAGKLGDVNQLALLPMMHALDAVRKQEGGSNFSSAALLL